jgi:recombination protein RecT
MTTEIQTRAEQSVATAEKPKNIKGWLAGDKFKEQIKMALPKHLTPERFVRVCLTALMKTPKLMECTQESVFKCMLDLSSVGLEPDNRLAHLIPYNNRKKGVMEAQVMIDYKGLIELSKRSGEVKNWRAECVCENDNFRWENGTVYHSIDWLNPRGKMQAVYSHIKNTLGYDDYEVMTKDQVDSIRKRSRSANDGPWVTDYDEMAKKTVMRRHSKRVTLSPEFTDAIEKDIDDQFETPEYSQADLMPKRMSESKNLIEESPSEPTQEQESKSEPKKEPKKSKVASSITPAGLSKIMAALQESKTTGRQQMMDFINKQYGVLKLNELSEAAVDEIVEYINLPPFEDQREPGADDE